MTTFFKFYEWVDASAGMNNRTRIVYGLLYDRYINRLLWGMNWNTLDIFTN